MVSSTTLTETRLALRPVPFAQIARADWDRLVAATPVATPFASWSFQRAWWDAYGTTAHEQYLVAATPDAPNLVRGIVPLMHRHYMEPQDAATATILRRHTDGFVPAQAAVDAECKTIFFAASYHADYATILAAPADLAAVAEALADYLALQPPSAHGDTPWEAVDLRRLRSADPALNALSAALTRRAASEGWQVIREQEDVCPVVSVGEVDWDGYLATLSKKARHEIRRKLRRAETAGELKVAVSRPDSRSVSSFIDLHSRRFGAQGLFPPTEGGARSRTFIERLADLERAEPDGQLLLAEVTAGERLIFAGLCFDDGATVYLYNAGIDPDAAELSPGVAGAASLIRERLGAGRHRFDFLRGDEPYKYEFGAVNEPVERLLVLRRDVEAKAA